MERGNEGENSCPQRYISVQWGRAFETTQSVEGVAVNNP